MLTASEGCKVTLLRKASEIDVHAADFGLFMKGLHPFILPCKLV